jgi:hypothetical protein
MSGQAFVFLKRERDKQDVRDRRDSQFEVPSTLAFSLQPSDHPPVPLFSQVSRFSRG